MVKGFGVGVRLGADAEILGHEILKCRSIFLWKYTCVNVCYNDLQIVHGQVRDLNVVLLR